MCPVGVVEGEVYPQGEKTILCSTWDDEADVLRQVLLVVLKNTSSFTRVVTPGREELNWNLIVSVPDDFPNKGELTFRDLIPGGWDIKKPHPEGVIHDTVLNYMYGGNFEDLPHISVLYHAYAVCP